MSITRGTVRIGNFHGVLRGINIRLRRREEHPAGNVPPYLRRSAMRPWIELAGQSCLLAETGKIVTTRQTTGQLRSSDLLDEKSEDFYSSAMHIFAQRYEIHQGIQNTDLLTALTQQGADVPDRIVLERDRVAFLAFGIDMAGYMALSARGKLTVAHRLAFIQGLIEANRGNLYNCLRDEDEKLVAQFPDSDTFRNLFQAMNDKNRLQLLRRLRKSLRHRFFISLPGEERSKFHKYLVSQRGANLTREGANIFLGIEG